MKQILVVDDQPDVREVLREFFTMQGYQVIEAEDGERALKQFSANQPDAAIVDIQMPVMDGIQFSETVLKEQKDFPIIMITGFIEKYSRDDLLDIGVRDVLHKPIDLSELNTKLLEYIN